MSVPETSRCQRARGALLGSFAGDALGMPFEGLPTAAIPDPVQMEEARLGRGTYTDDTEMMIALAEALAKRGEVQPDELARRFLEGHDPRRGYGAGTLSVFELWRGGVPVDEAAGRAFAGQGSLGNGAAMRIAPVGVRFADDPERLRDQARRSATITHAHPVAIDGAVVQASAVGAAMRGDPVLPECSAAAATDELRRRLDEVGRLLAAPGAVHPKEVAARLGHSSAAHESVPAAVFAACAAASFPQAVSLAVRCGGDTDTIGAMAGATAGALHGEEAIPPEWLEALEEGPRGRSHVAALAESLVA